LSFNDKSSGIDDIPKGAMRRSREISNIFALMTGTKAPGTPCGALESIRQGVVSETEGTHRNLGRTVGGTQHGLKDTEKIFSRDVFGHDAYSVDIRPWAMHTQPIGAKSEYFTTCGFTGSLGETLGERYLQK
jgi:hypothetical protein